MSDEKNGHMPDKKSGAKKDAPPEDAERAEEGRGDAESSGWAKGALEALKEENADLKDRLLRAAAEMENLRRRTERDKMDTAKFAISNFARDVLTIADNIQRAIDHVPEEATEKDPALKSFREGVQVTERELLKVMERHGITRLDPRGERFDPNKHQAMYEVDNKDVAEGTIVEVLQAGYVIAERVLRPAMVGVAKGGPKPAKSEEAAPPQTPHAANDDSKAKPETRAAPADKEPPEPKKGHGKDKKKVGGKVDKSA